MLSFKEWLQKMLNEEIDAVKSPPAIIRPAPASATQKKDPIGDLIKKVTKKPSSISDIINREKEFDEFADRTFKYEGPSGKVTYDAGGETKYGIAKRWHPDIDVKNLTPEGAKHLYRTRYFDVMGPMPHLSKKSRAIVLDAAFNQGPEFARQISNTHGDNPDALMKARLSHYRSLATNQPTIHGSSLKGWENRLKHLGKDIANLDDN